VIAPRVSLSPDWLSEGTSPSQAASCGGRCRKPGEVTDLERQRERGERLDPAEAAQPGDGRPQLPILGDPRQPLVERSATPLRDLYDLRHTYATFALRAGVPVFALSRFMGTSIAMIDLHYGHLALDSYQHAVFLLDALALERAVDAGWTPARRPAAPHSDTVSGPRERRSRRLVDAWWTSRSEAVTTRPNRRA
jgi:hypothetical protein